MMILRLSFLLSQCLQTLVAFQCSSDPTTKEFANDFQLEKNIMATKFKSIDSLFIFDKPCDCEFDWKQLFCLRLNAYRRMSQSEAPTVCVCRQFDGIKAGCTQFLTRCFQSWESTNSRHLNSKSKNAKASCQCCFNQPEEYCNQLECNNMKPNFGQSTNTSCLCYTQNNYPDWICNSKKSSSKMRKNQHKVRLYDSLLSSSDFVDEKKKSWPYSQNVAFVEEINLKRRIQESSSASREEKEEAYTMIPKRQLQQNPKSGFSGVWLSDNVVMLPMLVASCVVLLGLVGFGCFLVVVTKMQTKNEQNGAANGGEISSNGKIKRRYEKNTMSHPSPKAIILQNKIEHNAIRLTTHSSPKNQLIKPQQTVTFAPLPRTIELCELDYSRPCNCNDINKKSTVTVSV